MRFIFLLCALSLVSACIGRGECKCVEDEDYLTKTTKTRQVRNILQLIEDQPNVPSGLNMRDLYSAALEIDSWDELTAIQVRQCDKVLHMVEELIGLHKDLAARSEAAGSVQNFERLYRLFRPHAFSDELPDCWLTTLEKSFRTSEADDISVDEIKLGYSNYEALMGEIVNSQRPVEEAARLKSIMHLVFDLPILHDVIFPAMLESKGAFTSEMAHKMYREEMSKRGFRAGIDGKLYLMRQYRPALIFVDH